MVAAVRAPSDPSRGGEARGRPRVRRGGGADRGGADAGRPANPLPDAGRRVPHGVGVDDPVRRAFERYALHRGGADGPLNRPTDRQRPSTTPVGSGRTTNPRSPTPSTASMPRESWGNRGRTTPPRRERARSVPPGDSSRETGARERLERPHHGWTTGMGRVSSREGKISAGRDHYEGWEEGAAPASEGAVRRRGGEGLTRAEEEDGGGGRSETFAREASPVRHPGSLVSPVDARRVMTSPGRAAVPQGDADAVPREARALRRAFDLYDINGDGYITFLEVRSSCWGGRAAWAPRWKGRRAVFAAKAMANHRCRGWCQMSGFFGVPVWQTSLSRHRHRM